jgi:hypothetical protein
MHAEGFPDQPAQAIALDGTARRARADRHAEPRAAGFVWRILDDEQLIGETVARATRALELGGGAQLVAGPEPLAPRRKSLVSGVR